MAGTEGNPLLGTESNPFDWSTQAKQIASAPSLPEEGSAVYIMPASGHIRLVKKGEIAWAKKEYVKHKPSTPGVSSQKPLSTTAPEKNPTQRTTGTSDTAVSALPEEYPPFLSGTNFFKGIPVEVTGIPYEYKDICGNISIDNLIETSYESGTNSQAARFLNFRIDRFVFNFLKDGSLNLQRIYSYDETPAENGAFYPAQSGAIHDWKLKPAYHSHGGSDCSLDFYNDIAVSQAKLNEMRGDPSLNKVYGVLLSVAEDMDYDYPAIGRHAKFVTLPNGKQPLKGVCDGYANLLIKRLTAATIEGISNIQKVSGQNHAWVTLIYKGKTLYLDATWFDTNNIDENGVVDHRPYKNPRNMTFDNEIFTNHKQHHIPEGTKNIGS
jgi:hypothetical protein